MRKSKLPAIVIVIWLAIVGLVPVSLQPSSAAGAAGTIAYARGKEIRFIEPDGSNDRSVYMAPQAATYIRDLVWRPDSAALAFVSDQETICSWYDHDIFTIRPDGSGLKRVTNSPKCADLAAFPKGTVDVDIITNDTLVEAYVQGAPKAKFGASSGTVTFNDVADFGPRVVQPAVAIYGGTRWYGGHPPDVQPGQSVYAGPITAFPGLGGVDLPGAAKPSWTVDGSKLGYIYTNCGSAYQISANPTPGSIGNMVINGSASGVNPCVMDWGRSSNRASQFLYANWILNDIPGIYLATEGAPLPSTPLVPANLLNYEGEQVQDLKWLPDDSGFLFSQSYVDLGILDDIFRYDFNTGETTQLTMHLAVEDQTIRKLSISPDGQSVVFELAPAFNSPTGELWLMGINGSNPHLLVNNATSPTWSRGEVQYPLPLSKKAYLPVILRNKSY